LPPWEVAQGTYAFISGRARVMRVEEVPESNVDRMGVGARIESYKFGQTESSPYLTHLTFENGDALPKSIFFSHTISKALRQCCVLSARDGGNDGLASPNHACGKAVLTTRRNGAI